MRISLLLSLCIIGAGLITAAPVLAQDVDKELQFNDLYRTGLNYTLQDFHRETVTLGNRAFLAISLDHAGYVKMDEVGHPQLPYLTESLMIPDTAKMEVRVLASEYEEYTNVELLPYRGPIPRTVDPTTVGYTFGDVYQVDAFFPGEVASLRDPFILRDVRGQVVEIFPFQYNPVQKILRVYSNIQLEVAANGAGEINVIDRDLYGYKTDRSFTALYERSFPNYSAGAVQPIPLSTSGSRTEPPSEDGDMLVICHGSFMAAMQPFVDWKNSIGINTTLVDVASIGNNSTSIKNYITGIYNAGNLAYVLLVGDLNEIKSPSYAGGESDPTYSTITADWYPDLFVGRFSAQTAAHVDTQVQRTLEYEQQGHDLGLDAWNAKGMGVASNQGSGQGHYGEGDSSHIDKIRSELLNYGFTTVDQIYDYSGTKAQVTSALNNGRRIVHYCGHGSTTAWTSTGFNNNDVNNLTNVGKLPFICSVACVNGDFGSTTCFAEAWMRATHNGDPTGAVACYMSSINQSWAPPMYGQGNHGTGGKYGGAERFWSESNWSIGGEWYGGSCAMMDAVGNSGREMFMTWILFGDPSLRVIGTSGDLSLTADASTLPVTRVEDVNFTIDMGSAFAGYNYYMMGSLSGTDPGLPLPGGQVLPINFDFLTNMIISNVNSVNFQDFYSTLDASGMGYPIFSTQGQTPLDPSAVGAQLSFAAIIWTGSGATFDAVTNARTVTFVN